MIDPAALRALVQALRYRCEMAHEASCMRTYPCMDQQAAAALTALLEEREQQAQRIAVARVEGAVNPCAAIGHIWTTRGAYSSPNTASECRRCGTAYHVDAFTEAGEGQ